MIGVIVTYHNQARHFGALMRSLAAQTHRMAVVVADDGSSAPPEVPPGLPFPVYIRRFAENQGVQHARNMGWNEMRKLIDPEFVLFCDGDVLWFAGAVDRMAEFLDARPGVGYAYSDYERSGALTGMFRAGEFDADRLRSANYISTMSLIRAAVLPQRPFLPEEERLQDWSLWLRLLNRGIEGGYVPGKAFRAYYSPDDVSCRNPQDYLKWRCFMQQRYC